MRTRILVAAALLMLAMAEGRAQSFLELLQKGIYLQETVGDLDGAIRLYRQILAGAAAGDVRSQAPNTTAPFSSPPCLRRSSKN